MKKTFFMMLCVFIVLFALANQCDKSVPDNPPTIENKSYPMPTKADAYQHSSTKGTTVCNICGNRFTGRGFTEVAHGQWQEAKEPYTTSICSRSCGMQHTRNWEEKLQKVHVTLPAQPSGYTGHSDENTMNDPCGLCGGTGVETNRYGDTSICPVCDGSGKRNI